MAEEQNPPAPGAPSDHNAHEPTDNEALYASQLDGLGDDPQEEPTAPGAAPAPDKDGDAAPPVDEPADGDAGAVGESEDGAGADEGVGEPPAAAAPAPAPAPTPAPSAPVPPKDFDAEAARIQKAFEDGSLDAAEFQQQLRALNREEVAFATRLEIYNERQQTAAQQAENAWNEAAAAWERDHADFMSNPIRAAAVASAIASIDKQTGGALAPAELLQRAEAAAFDAFGYKPPSAAVPKDDAAAIAAAIAARTPAKVPTTLASAPAAAPIEASRNSSFADLDGQDIDSLENSLARMTPAQRDEYLRDAPGASSTGR